MLCHQARRKSHQDICDSLELFAREVMPEFHANVPEHDAWKAKVVSGEIQLEDIDTDRITQRYGDKAVRV